MATNIIELGNDLLKQNGQEYKIFFEGVLPWMSKLPMPGLSVDSSESLSSRVRAKC
jgi:hypothetical protein